MAVGSLVDEPAAPRALAHMQGDGARVEGRLVVLLSHLPVYGRADMTSESGVGPCHVAGDRLGRRGRALRVASDRYADLDAAGTFHHRSVDGAAIAKGQRPVGDLDGEPAVGDGVARVALIVEHVAEAARCGIEDGVVAAVADRAAARIAHGDGGCGGGEFRIEGVEPVVGEDSPVALEFKVGAGELGDSDRTCAGVADLGKHPMDAGQTQSGVADHHAAR